MTQNTKSDQSNFSNLEDFFCKEIKDIDYGICLQSYPCEHPDIKVTYEDDSVKHFKVDGRKMFLLCKRLNKELPEHFEVMKYCPIMNPDQKLY